MKLTLIHKYIRDLTPEEKVQFFNLLGKYFKDPTSLLERELKKNTQVLIALVDNMLAGLFMTGWDENIDLQGNKTTLIYIGISCTDPKFKTSRIGKILFTELSLKTRAYEIARNRKVSYWFTTASPLALNAASKHWNILAPSQNGQLTGEAKSIFEFIKTRYNLIQYSDPQVDFILRKVAVNTQYNDEYSAFLASVQQKIKIPLFDLFEISERQGDRFLFYAVNHDDARIKTLKLEYEEALSRFSECELVDET